MSNQQTIELTDEIPSLFSDIAVQDKIDLSSYSDTPPVVDESSIDTKMLLPSESDYDQLKKNFSHHVARVLKEYMPFFSSFGSGLERHICHRYYEEMLQKSEVVSYINLIGCITMILQCTYTCSAILYGCCYMVPLGILLKSESKYVPTLSKETVPGDVEEVDVTKNKFSLEETS